MPPPDIARLRLLGRLGAVVCGLAALGLAGAQYPRGLALRFDFGPGAIAPGFTQVLPTSEYTSASGFGFEPGPAPQGLVRGRDPLRDDLITSNAPFFFSVAVPEGNYRVTVTLGDPAAGADTTVYAELRRLMLERVVTPPGTLERRSFLVNVRRPAIAGGGTVTLKDREKTTEVWAWDDRLTLEFNGPRPAVAAVELERVEVPTLYLLGDSTMCDQPVEPYNSWGQMLTRFLEPVVSVANHAESGESLSGALAAGRVRKVWSEMRRGDYLFVQFGHNDMKSVEPGALETYGSNMRQVVEETRRRGGRPVLVTSVSRRTFDPEGKKILDSFQGYTQAVRQVAAELSVPLIDLQACSATLYEALGPEASHLAFATPQEGTHHGDYGSYQIVKCVLMGIRNAKLDLAQAITADFTPFDAAAPDAFERVAIPKSPRSSKDVPTAQAGAVARAREIAESGNDTVFDMAPETRLEVVAAAVTAIPVALPPGPVQPSWESLAQYYRVPTWFNDARLGIFLHWGIYAVPAYHNEWYEQHMYNRFIGWHTEHFGAAERFGYKDFIPLFTAAKWDPEAWAELFRKSGAKYVVPTAQHHDNFALWDSAVAPWNAKQMGPRRDLIGELAAAVRRRGLKYGVSNHGIENFQFIHPDASAESRALIAELQAKQADLFDPKWVRFYNVADRSDEACRRFLVDWALRNVELIDKYRPDMLWFDNGVDQRYLDPLKLWMAAYYYNRAAQWGKPVSLSTKKAAFAPSGLNTGTIGSIIDFEKIGPRSPAGIRSGSWQVDHPIGSTWGYTSDMTVSGPAAIVRALADTASKNGNLLLNLSPMADGTIPAAQQQTLLALGRWLDVNGDAIYGTHHWLTWRDAPTPVPGAPEVRYTVKGDALFAIVLGDWTGGQVTLRALGTEGLAPGRISAVAMLGHGREHLRFTRSAGGLTVTLPPRPAPPLYGYVLKITGLEMNKSIATASGNPS